MGMIIEAPANTSVATLLTEAHFSQQQQRGLGTQFGRAEQIVNAGSKVFLGESIFCSRKELEPTRQMLCGQSPIVNEVKKTEPPHPDPHECDVGTIRIVVL